MIYKTVIYVEYKMGGTSYNQTVEFIDFEKISSHEKIN